MDTPEARVEVRAVDRTDEAQLHAWWQCGHDAMATRPVDLWPDWEISRHALPQVDPDHRIDLFAAYDGDVVVGSGLVVLPQQDNTHYGLIEVHVPPARRRRGYGGRLLEHAEAIVTGEGRRTLMADVCVPVAGLNDDARWAEARGYAVANVDGIKVADLAATAERWPDLEAEAAAKLGDHELTWWLDPAPEAHIASFAAARSRFIEEIPLGDLDLRPQALTAERLRHGEARRAAQRRQQLTVAALAPSGEVAGYTVLTLAPHAPRLAEIGDTLVLPNHRGHRIGLAVKVLLHQQVRRSFPGVELIVTGNATTNRWMNDVNDRLGYVVVDRALELQKVLP